MGRSRWWWRSVTGMDAPRVTDPDFARAMLTAAIEYLIDEDGYTRFQIEDLCENTITECFEVEA